jgi:heme-degrading monooxygenase HmoA
MSTRRVVVFRNRLRPDVGAEYGATGDAMYAIAEKMPGFLSAKDFVADDGERLTIVEFESDETLAAWRDQPDHQRAQASGRERWYSEYSLQICDVIRSSRFDAATGTWERKNADPK